jgi:hypothetical protein
VLWSFSAYVLDAAAGVVLKSDRAALDAIARQLRETREFDEVIVSGKAFEAAPLPTKWGRLAHLEMRDDPSSAPDMSPLMMDNRGRYRLTVALRQGKDDKKAADEIDRIKRVVWNALMADGARDYGGFCHGWRSRLRPVGRARPKDIGLLLLFDGEFYYHVDMGAGGYSEAS